MEENAARPDRRAFLAGALMASALCTGVQAQVKQRRPTYVDGLTLNIGSDLDLLKQSGIDALITDISAGEEVRGNDGTVRYYRSFDACRRAIVGLRQTLRQRADVAILATRGSDIARARAEKKTAIFLQFQGCEPIGEDLSRIDLFYELGLRILQITHHHNNPLGGGAIEKEWTGLTQLGREGIERMNSLGIIPDLSHAGDVTAMDVLKLSRRPVIISHGAARALVNNARCTADEVIRGVAKSGGVMGVFMMSFWLTTDPDPTPEALVKQIRHIINVGGIDTIGIANDYSIRGEMSLVKLNNNNREGVKSYHGWWQSAQRAGALGFDRLPEHVVIPELNNVRRMFTIHETLDQAGFKSTEIEKIMGLNWIRVLTASLG